MNDLIFRVSDRPLNFSEITSWLRDLRAHPHVPYSNYDVSAVLRMEISQGKQLYFAGVNVEYPQARLSTHGEEGAIAALVTLLGKKARIDEVFVMGAPSALSFPSNDPLADLCGQCCGNCRQRLSGFASADVMAHSISLNGKIDSERLGVLLPKSFSFKDFMPQAVQENGRAALDVGALPPLSLLMREGEKLNQEELWGWLCALNPWDLASNQGEAVIAEFEGGRYAACVRIEDAAFTGTSALQGVFAISSILWKNILSQKGALKALHFKGHEGTQKHILTGAGQLLNEIELGAGFTISFNKTEI